MLKLSKIARASEWWEYKLPPMLAIAYATGLSAGKNLYELTPRLCILLLGIIIGAVYVSIVNDFTDRKEDEASGKHNRLRNLSPQVRWFLILAPVVTGFFFAYFFLSDTLSIAMYTLCWIAFSLYSIPPFRLKKRGLSGVLADASGAHLFPTLFLLSSTAYYFNIHINWFWFSVNGVWS
jgi:4-hydroxybenzoate polyprenyltransferase